MAQIKEVGGAVLDTAHLVQQIQSGDKGAENAFVSHYRPGLEIIARRLTRDPTLADDLLQETLALVLTKIRQGEVRQPEALASFIRSTARNLFIADRRKESRYSELADGGETLAAETSWTLPNEGPQLRQLLAREESLKVRQLLDEMRFDRDRELLFRVYLQGDSKETICADLDVKPDLYNRVLYRARQRLRELWEKAEKRARLGVE